MFLAPDRSYDLADALSEDFASASPFPHVVLEGLLGDGAERFVDAFPDPTWEGWYRYPDKYQQGKMICSDYDRLPVPLQALITELQSPRFLQFLEQISGVRHLIPDPYLEGGGLHCSGPGGILTTHTDFHFYGPLSLYRRLNVLLYLNPEWEQDWGGCLELFTPGFDEAGASPAKVVVPRLGTCVIFRTDDRSPHGFNTPVEGDRWRRSIALYYYTAHEAERYSGDTTTYWRTTPERTRIRRARQQAYRALIFGSRTLAFIAHRVDPRTVLPSER